ncbi:MAG: hypothetical protein ACK4TO_04415 [Candidatus Nitrosotenuis sp.]
MKSLLLLMVVVASTPAFAQEFTNPSLVLQHIDIVPADFNKVESDIVIVPFEKTHAGSWQITIQNDLIYANPKGNAVLRLYDANISDKFLEIGMGSPPERKFWVAVNLPDQGYVPATRLDKDGWYDGSKIIAAHSDAQGVSVGNGKRIVVSNFNLQDFVVGSYAVYGMTDETDPPAINSGSFNIEILSGDVSKNPIHYYPFYVTGAVGAIIGILLILKKRS